MKTYCNPLMIEDLPVGRWLDCDLMNSDPTDTPDYRSIADPTVIWHDGKWIMYPSYGVAYVSSDFIHWKHVDIGIPHLRYSPAVVRFRGRWYLSGHGMDALYVSDSPTGPFTLCGHMIDRDGNRFAPPDGCFLCDIDKISGEERLYFYWCGSMPKAPEDDVEAFVGTMGVELDPECPWKQLGEPVCINRFEPEVAWQRFGEHNQNRRMGWIEGQWMIRRGDRYYLMYSGSGTGYSAYANGIMYSDEGPLSGFKVQKNNGLLTEKRTGLIRGAGHGSIAEGPGGSLWIFYTNTFCYHSPYERRIGMDPIGIDANGELFCPAVTDTPQYAPGVLPHPELGNSAGWLPLTFMERPTASSFACGRAPIYATDDSTLTWWQPCEDDNEPTLTIRLDYGTRYSIFAVRLIWRDVGMETMVGIMPGAFRYVIEYSPEPTLSVWKTLIDASENELDLPIDYRETSGERAYGVRLRILGAPNGITPALVSFTAFGESVREV